MRDLRRAATDGPRFRRGTVRTPESVPGCSIEVPEVSASTFAGTVRAERTRPAESPANGFVRGAECGAIPAVPPTGRVAPFNSSPGRRRLGLRHRRTSFRGPLRTGAGRMCSRYGTGKDHGDRHGRSLSAPIRALRVGERAESRARYERRTPIGTGARPAYNSASAP